MPSPNIHFFLRLLRTPHQFRNAWRWLVSTRSGSMRYPWISFPAIDYLEKRSFEGCRVFEYGSGASTAYWLRRGARVVSVEHDPAWYARVRGELGEREDLSYYLEEPAPSERPSGSKAAAADPDSFAAGGEKYRGLTFESYVRRIAAYPDESFDLVLIDGRARASCIKQSVRKIAPGGLLILDNADRPHYTEKAACFLEGWARERFSGPVAGVPLISCTDIYTRPL